MRCNGPVQRQPSSRACRCIYTARMWCRGPGPLTSFKDSQAGTLASSLTLLIYVLLFFSSSLAVHVHLPSQALMECQLGHPESFWLLKRIKQLEVPRAADAEDDEEECAETQEAVM